MHLGLITLDLFGHLNPMTTLGAKLVTRNHKVTLIGGRDSRDLALQRGLQHALIGVEDDLDLKSAAEFKKLGRLNGMAAMLQSRIGAAIVNQMHLRDLPKVFNEMHFDGLLIDQVTPVGYVVGQKMGLESIIVSNALMLLFDPWHPSPSTNWDFRTDLYGLARNHLANFMLASIHRVLKWREQSEIDPLLLVFERDLGLARISQQPPFFDFPRKWGLPENMHYTGPWNQSGRDDDIDFPWDRVGDGPIIYASMGTLQNNLQSVFDAIIQVVSQQKMTAVVSKGGSQVRVSDSLPEHVVVVDFAPQMKLLPRTQLAITHAGLNTALECLSHGVPMLCLPVTNDQPGVAKRIQWLGMGECLPVSQVTTSRLNHLLTKMLQSPAYAEKTRHFQQIIVQQDGLNLAVEIIEKALFPKVNRH